MGAGRGQTGVTQQRGASASPGGQATSVTRTSMSVKRSTSPMNARRRMPGVKIFPGGTDVPVNRVTRKIRVPTYVKVSGYLKDVYTGSFLALSISSSVGYSLSWLIAQVEPLSMFLEPDTYRGVPKGLLTFLGSLYKARSGELRTQKLKSHLVRIQSLNVLPFKPGVGQYRAIHATLTARDFFLAYFYTSSPFTCIFSKTSPKIFPVLAVANTWFLCRPAE